MLNVQTPLNVVVTITSLAMVCYGLNMRYYDNYRSITYLKPFAYTIDILLTHDFGKGTGL